MKIITLDNRKLALKNNGDLELFFIGAGSAFTRRQYQTNLLIVKGDDHLLIDCGTKCNQALWELGVKISDIRHFLITHSHADHIGGLEEVSLINRYVTRRKPIMVINETYQYILWDMSLRGGCAFNEEEAKDMLGFSDFWDVIRPAWMPDFPRETFGAKIGSIDIKIMRTKHIPDSSEGWQSSFWSCGVIIDDRVMFTSDTRYDPDLVEYYDKRYNFEAIFHDCQFYTGGVHASIDELNQLPEDIKKKTHLCHYNDNWEDHEKKVKDYGFAALARQHQFYNFG
jgi:ribonuclease BN (tRNA processing enzyme)